MWSWSLSVSAPEKDLVFVLLMLYLKRWGYRMKSVWLRTGRLVVCQVAFLDNVWGWKVFARVSRWLFANSRSLHLLLFVSAMPNLPTVLASAGMRQGLLRHPNRLEQQAYPSWESLLWCYEVARSSVRPPHRHGLRLVHRPWWRDVMGSRWNPDGNEFVWDRVAADGTTYNLFP